MAKNDDKNLGSLTGAPSPKPGEKGDATDPLQAPAMDASPERFLAQVPAHIAVLGEEGSAPNAVTDSVGRRRYRMHDASGKVIAKHIRPAGETFWLDPAEAAKHPELTEVDAAGKPVVKTEDKIANRQTGEADGLIKR